MPLQTSAWRKVGVFAWRLITPRSSTSMAATNTLKRIQARVSLMCRVVRIRNEIAEKRKAFSFVLASFELSDLRTNNHEGHEGSRRLDLSLVDQTNCVESYRTDDLQAIRTEFVYSIVSRVMEHIVVS